MVCIVWLSAIVAHAAVPKPEDEAGGWNRVRGIAVYGHRVEVATDAGVKSRDLAGGGWHFEPGGGTVAGCELSAPDRIRFARTLRSIWGVPLEVLRRGDPSATPWLLARSADGTMYLIHAGRRRMIELDFDQPQTVRGFAVAEPTAWLASTSGLHEINLDSTVANRLTTRSPFHAVTLTFTIAGRNYLADRESGLFEVHRDGSLDSLEPARPVVPRMIYRDVVVLGATAYLVAEDGVQSGGVAAELRPFGLPSGWLEPVSLPWSTVGGMAATEVGILLWAIRDDGDEGTGSSLQGGMGSFDPGHEVWSVITEHAVDAVLRDPLRAREWMHTADDGNDEGRWDARVLWVPPGSREFQPASPARVQAWTNEWPGEWQRFEREPDVDLPPAAWRVAMQNRFGLPVEAFVEISRESDRLWAKRRDPR